MIKVGETVECIDKQDCHFGKIGTFKGYIANGLEVQFNDGQTGLYLPCSLKIIQAASAAENRY